MIQMHSDVLWVSGRGRLPGAIRRAAAGAVDPESRRERRTVRLVAGGVDCGGGARICGQVAQRPDYSEQGDCRDRGDGAGDVGVRVDLRGVRRGREPRGDSPQRVGVASKNAGFELEFFQELDHALSAAANRRLVAMRIDGLRACVMKLRGARRWTAECRRLAEDIVEHVRGRVVRMRSPRAASLKLAVVE